MEDKYKKSLRCGMKVKKIPDSYVAAQWRNTTPLDKESQEIGIGFALETSGIIRLRIDLKSACHLRDSIGEFIANYKKACSHSDKSSGNLNLDVSIPGGEKV